MKFLVHDVEGETMVRIDATSEKEAIKGYIKRVNPEFDEGQLEMAYDEFNGYAVDESTVQQY